MSDDIKKLEEIKNNSKLSNDVDDSLSSVGLGKGSEPILDTSSHRYECRNCGYIYEPIDGVKKFDIPSGTPFSSLDQFDFRCPVCRMGVENFKDIGSRSSPSGFEDNLNYGFGINNLTSGQKNVLIFGGLAFAVACFLSLYSLH